jgi:Predicted phosphoglycerate mutase, AP superfamily
MTKFIICLGDGMADHPIPELDNKTPLEYAKTPSIDHISKKGVMGMVDTVPQGFHPGSDVANMGILGVDPATCYSGRGPIEAASMGVTCQPDEIIFRCNLVTIKDAIMKDFTADHITTEESGVLIHA